MFNYGAKGDGITNDAAAIQAAVNAGDELPEGILLCKSPLELATGKRIHGQGVDKTILRFTVTDYEAAITRVPDARGVTSYCELSNLTIEGTDGSGGVGLHLDAFKHLHFENVTISKFRNANKNGIGLLLTNHNESCGFNHFTNLCIKDCDTALEMDSLNSQYATGYNTFIGTVIYQEQDCLALLSSNANGSIYNVFSGLFLQGNGGAGTYINIEGSGNLLDGVVLDGAGSGTQLSFTKPTTSGNRVTWLTGLDPNKIVNNQTSGAPNTVQSGSAFTGAPGKPYRISDPSGDLTFGLSAAGADKSVEVQFGNDTALNLWRLVMQANVNPNLSLLYGSNLSTLWDRAGNMTLWIGDLKVRGAGKGVCLTNAAGTITKRIRLNDAGDGLIFEAV